MTTQTLNTEKDVVKNLRKIRDEMSNEIKDMTFEEQRAYMDKLLSEKDKFSQNKGFGKIRDEE